MKSRNEHIIVYITPFTAMAISPFLYSWDRKVVGESLSPQRWSSDMETRAHASVRGPLRGNTTRKWEDFLALLFLSGMRDCSEARTNKSPLRGHVVTDISRELC